MKFLSYFAGLILLFLVGCSSGPQVTAEAGPDLSPTMSPIEVLDASEAWLAPETAGLMVVSGPDGWDELERYIFPLADASLTPGMPGTAQGLMTELRELLLDWMGFDLTQIHSAAIGVHAEGARVVVFGDLGEQIHLPQAEGADGTVYELSLDRFLGGQDDPYGASPFAATEMSIYLRPLTEPRPGVVFGFSLDDVAIGEGLGGGHGEELRKLLQEVDGDGPSAVLAGVTGAIPELAYLGMPLPDSLVLSFGDLVTLAASGDEAVLGQLQELIDFHFEELRLEVVAEYDQRHELDYLERALLIYGYHLMQGLAAQLEPERTVGMLRYDLEFSEQGLLTALSLGSSLGLAAGALTDWFLMADDDHYDPFAAPGLDVVVASVDIEACTALSMQIVEIMEVPAEFTPDDVFLFQDFLIYEGQMIASEVNAGDMILTSDFDVEGECD